MNFYDRLNYAFDAHSSLLCIGLDTDFNKIPKHIQNKKDSLFVFNKAIIDATADLVSTYKPNSAFYEALGADGIRQLQMTCEYIKKKHPKLLLLLDAKRADIGNTNTKYLEYAYDYLGVDAVTIHPYLGEEGIGPFLERKDKGCVILCRTSNEGAREFQDLIVGKTNKMLFQVVAQNVARKWNKNKNCMMVIGATYPEEIKVIRKIAPEVPFLIPGIGAQGGDLEASLKAGLMSDRKGLIISASRSVLYASKGRDFAEKAREEAMSLNDSINSVRKSM